MATIFAAVDGGVAAGERGTGAVYSVAETAADALAQAQRDAGHEGQFDVVPCSAEAAAYVADHGGEPSHRLSITRYGVELDVDG